jgi:ribosome-binding protein aMBF1 (putative translation factor)
MSGFLSALVSRMRKGLKRPMPKVATDAGTPLRAARLAEGRGWSLRYVAKRIHSNPTSLSEWERGISDPPRGCTGSSLQALSCITRRFGIHM